MPGIRSRRRGRFVRGAVALVLAAGLALALGPRARVADRWVEPDLPTDLDTYLRASEAALGDVRPGDERAVVWARPGERTPVALVYLHGFSADRHEIEPVVSELGRRIGANVYFARLAGHGRSAAAMGDPTADDWLADAAEALAIGGRIGERVVVVGTSTGATLATWLATRPEAAGRLAALVLVSPNYQPRDRSSRLLLLPWGGTLARLVVGPERCFTPENDAQERHWTTCYPTSALVPMMAVVELVRTKELSSITVPTLVLRHPDDAVVDPEETLRVVRRMTATRPRVEIVESTTDPAHHVLAGDIVSPTSTGAVIALVSDFLRTQGLVEPMGAHP